MYQLYPNRRRVPLIVCVTRDSAGVTLILCLLGPEDRATATRSSLGIRLSPTRRAGAYDEIVRQGVS